MAAGNNRQPVNKVLAFQYIHLFLCPDQASGAEAARLSAPF
jgi:hypothetical protein